ncbi:MAG: M48 family metallopeptidase [bacterium]|nr:M48 family metallopeptidase [bacterium]
MNVYQEISANNRKTLLILLLFTVVVMAIAFLASVIILSQEYSTWTEAAQMTWLYFPTISATVLVVILLWTLISYFTGDKMILSFMGAKPVERKEQFELYNTVENLAITAGLPVPKIYLIQDDSLNAFATGRNPHHSVICFTTGIVKKLNKQELEAVAAHELSHIANYDIRLQLIIVTVIGIIAMVGEVLIRVRGGGSDRKGGGAILLAGIFILLVGYPLLTLIKLALSRKREYLADASGALLTRDPHSLANALEKIAVDPRIESADSMKAAAHLFIDDPSVEPGMRQKDQKQSKISWFAQFISTHPPIQERIKKLREEV